MKYYILYILLFLVVNFSFFIKVSGKDKPEDSTIQVMLLGVYHFDNPGMDKYNLEIDDYFSDKRQQEIDEVVSLLAQFEPDKIFIEQKPSAQRRIDSLYQAYSAERLDLKDLERGRNEIYQIGFKLAKESGVKKMDCIDADGYWLGPYADFIADTLELTYYNEEEEKAEESIKSVQEQFHKRTVKENLVFTNQPESIMENHRYYIDIAMRVKDTIGIYFTYQENTREIDEKEYLMRSFDFNNIGIELVTEWYKRNFYIYRNILEKSVSEDKIIVIMGQGHIPVLQQLLEDNAKYKVVTPLDYL